ncbi:hypothetical protein ACFSUS_24870 [Spirosoma soli]|uniref:DUF3575 domain-containing protein n=1 Tax=Spirosoma soli TaxID=1770529 RepID=A0ABW5MA81_9BACT
MSFFCLWRLLILCTIWVSTEVSVCAQAKASVEKPTRITVTPEEPVRSPDSVRVAQPTSLTFTASTDQRFFFFKDTRNEENRRIPISVYGIRAGFLFPARHERKALQGGRLASFKAGAGFYFVNQHLDRPGLLPNTSASVTRHLRIVTLYYERYLLRKKSFEISLPLELGYGHSRYERNDDPSNEHEVARGVFIPAGVGVAAAYQFPNLRWLRPFHWFGFNVLTGYRFILKRDVPRSQINYTGFYISVGPSFFLENLTADIKTWRHRRQRK